MRTLHATVLQTGCFGTNDGEVSNGRGTRQRHAERKPLVLHTTSLIKSSTSLAGVDNADVEFMASSMTVVCIAHTRQQGTNRRQPCRQVV